MNINHPALPYQDTKPQGAADFYFAINATFRFLLRRFGPAGWQRYLEELGRDYFRPVNATWKQGGLAAVAEYWREFFAAEPGAAVEIHASRDQIEIKVQRCPAISHLRAAGREIVPEYCQHCFFLGSARAQEAGLTMRLQGGNGSCCHTYAKNGTGLPPQDMAAIATVTSKP